MNDPDMMSGGEVADDLIISKKTGKNSPFIENAKETYGPFNKSMKEHIEIERKMKKQEDPDE